MRNGLLWVSSVALCCLIPVGCISRLSEERAIEHYVQGELLLEDGETEAALEELAEAIRNDADLSIAHATIGDIHRRNGDYEYAGQAYERACQANPYAFHPHYHLGLTYQLLAELTEAFEKVEQYLRRAVEIYQRAVELRPEDFDTNLNLSVCHFGLGQVAEAEQYCRRAIELRPDSAAAHANLGIIEDQQGDLYEAIKAYKTSLELESHQPSLLVNLGSAYMRQNRLDPALRSFEEACREDPNYAPAWEKKGVCLFYMKQFDRALEAYETAIGLDSNSASVYRGVGVVHMTRYVMEGSDPTLRDKALEAWNASLEIKPDQEDLKRLVEKYTPRLEAPSL